MIDKNSIMEILSQTKLYEKNLEKATKQFKINTSPKGVVKIGNFDMYDDQAKLDYEELLYGRFGKYTYNFAKTLNSQLPAKDLRIMESNIRDIKIKRNFINSIYMNAHGILQFYDPIPNLISTNYNNNKTKGIYHELFHMASCNFDSLRNKIYCGFMYDDIAHEFEIGRSLNEGYTELLANRYFGKDISNSSKPYRFSQVYAEKIERIIGQEEMTHLYLNHDLVGLIADLEKYAKEDSIFNFLGQTDYLISERIGKRNNPIRILGIPVIEGPDVPGKEEYTIKNFININDFLIETYANKVNQEPISKQEKITDLNAFIYDLRKEQINIYDKYQYTSMLKDYTVKLTEDGKEKKMKYER